MQIKKYRKKLTVRAGVNHYGQPDRKMTVFFWQPRLESAHSLENNQRWHFVQNRQCAKRGRYITWHSFVPQANSWWSPLYSVHGGWHWQADQYQETRWGMEERWLIDSPWGAGPGGRGCNHCCSPQSCTRSHQAGGGCTLKSKVNVTLYGGISFSISAIGTSVPATPRSSAMRT